MVKTVQWVGIVAGLAAAGLWLWSALIVVPAETVGLWGGPAPEFAQGLRHQSRLSAFAATFAALSMFAQASALWINRSR